jgi:hypothetical protein
MNKHVFVQWIAVFVAVLSVTAWGENQMLIQQRISEEPEIWRLTRDVVDSVYGVAMFKTPMRAAMSYVHPSDTSLSEMLFVVDFMYNRVMYNDHMGGDIYAYGEFGIGDGPDMRSPTSIDVITIQDDEVWLDYYWVLVADWANGRIKRLKYYWQTNTFADMGAIQRPEIFRPIDLDIFNGCMHSDLSLGHVWIVSTNCSISAFNFDGDLRNSYGSSGSGVGQFNEPMAIACGRDASFAYPTCEPYGNTSDVYIADAGNSRIVWLYASPYNPVQWLAVWESPFAYYISDLEVDPLGNVWATLSTGNIIKLTKYLEYLSMFGTQGFGPNQFFRPMCIANAGGYLGSADMCITESFRDSSGIQYYVIGTDIEQISIVEYPGSPQCNANFMFKLLDQSRVGISLYDLEGEPVRTIKNGGILQPGLQSFWWDGKNSQGQTVPNGYYRAQIADTSTYVWKSGEQQGQPINIVTKNEWFYFCDLGFCSTGDGATHPPGDCSKSDMIDIDDIVCAINYVFSGGPTWCPPYSVDADISGVADVDDIVFLINYVFSGGPAPLPCSMWVTANGVPTCE